MPPSARPAPDRTPFRPFAALPFLVRGRTGGIALPAGFPGIGRAAPETLGRLGPLEVRLAASPKEVKRAQRLRYKVFYEEMSAVPTGLAALKRRDVDDYDSVCDHLLVLDHDAPSAFAGRKPKVVGTYRLLRQDVAEAHGGFYTAGEYDIGPLLERQAGKRFLELGRSCVLKPYRNRRTIELLWAGLWAYVQAHAVDAMIGCASFEGTDPERLALPLSFLHSHVGSPPEWRVRARPERYVAMDRLPLEAIDRRAGVGALPPLVKAYLRVGATFGDGAVIDRQFGTTDVFVVLPVAGIGERYLAYFGPAANRYTA